jgi:beta-glucanase (GH16 family)
MSAFTRPSPNEASLFCDDFTDSVLNPANWNVEITGTTYNQEVQAYIHSTDTLYTTQTEPDAQGALALHARWHPGYRSPQGETFDFVSARINTAGKVSFRYGRVSARLKMPSGTGLWPAFWALGENGDWPACGELDIMETVGESDWLGVAVHGPHYFGDATPFVNKKYFSPPHSIAEWHTCTLECRPESLLFFVDDELVFRVTRAMVNFYGQWVFDSEKYIILNLALGGVYPFKTNGVNQPYFGLPTQTVERIQNNQARLLVDWVRITPL